MTTKVVKAIKLVAVPLLFIIGMISCEGDIENVGVGVIDNGLFDTKQYSSNVLTYNQNDLEVKANRLGQYLLGIYENDDFGQLNASIAGQLTFISSIDFGVDPKIDSVILNIPYQATRDTEDNSGGSPKWELDSIFGNQDVEYKLSVYELKTYLNTLDPSNPGEVLDYYSDQTYLFNPTALYDGLFKPSKNDTVLYIQRKEIIIDEDTMEHDVDTIKTSTVSPSIKLPLDTDYFTTNFLNNPAVFENPSAFIEFFNGLYIQASKVNASDKTSIMSLNFTISDMTIYYTNTVDDERKKQSARFGYTGVTNNIYDRDYTDSNAKVFLDNPNIIDGDTRLYLNGAAGSFALIDLFTDENIADLRSNNWLINEANIIFYIDNESADESTIPEQIFLYNYEDETQISDVLIDGLISFGGQLERDDDGNPYRYKINITNYISRILSQDDPRELKQLAIKVFNISDTPLQITDVIVQDYSWTPKGVVVHGNQSEDIEKRIVLEIVYTERN